MSAGMRTRLVGFIVLSAVGIVYVAATYLGLVDKVLGRGITVEATLPTSGGLFEGSAVTYRGVSIGSVEEMTATDEGITLRLALEEGTELPVDSPMFVHNLSAVGEQYLDFEPPSDEGPYAENGTVLEGSVESIPVDEADLLIELDAFVGSVDREALQTTVAELGRLFDDTGRPLQQLLDNGGDFIDAAAENEPYTRALLQRLRIVLGTQADTKAELRAFSRDLRLVTQTLRQSDQDLRTILDQTPGAVREVQTLLEDLEPTLPILLGNAISVQQVAVTHLDGIEQLLVTFPRLISSGFTGTTADGYGQVNLQFDQTKPCTDGYLPPSQWRQGNDLTDAPIFPAKCDRLDTNYRGFNYTPSQRASRGEPGRAAVGYYDPRTGRADGIVDSSGNPVRLGSPPMSILGEDAWKWMLVGPVIDQ